MKGPQPSSPARESHEKGCVDASSPSKSAPSNRSAYSIANSVVSTGKELERAKWQENAEAPTCNNQDCRVKFSIITRQHHCRRCGLIFCWRCAPFREVLQEFLPGTRVQADGEIERQVKSTPSAVKKKRRLCDGCQLMIELDIREGDSMLLNMTLSPEHGVNKSIADHRENVESNVSPASKSADSAVPPSSVKRRDAGGVQHLNIIEEANGKASQLKIDSLAALAQGPQDPADSPAFPRSVGFCVSPRAASAQTQMRQAVARILASEHLVDGQGVQIHEDEENGNGRRTQCTETMVQEGNYPKPKEEERYPIRWATRWSSTLYQRSCKTPECTEAPISPGAGGQVTGFEGIKANQVPDLDPVDQDALDQDAPSSSAARRSGAGSRFRFAPADELGYVDDENEEMLINFVIGVILLIFLSTFFLAFFNLSPRADTMDEESIALGAENAEGEGYRDADLHLDAGNGGIGMDVDSTNQLAVTSALAAGDLSATASLAAGEVMQYLWYKVSCLRKTFWGDGGGKNGGGSGGLF